MVGAGPTGLAVAGLLVRRGIAVTVLDRHPEPYPRPRAVHLDGGSARVLQALGLHERFAALSRPATGLRLLDASLRPFATFRRDIRPGWHGHPDANLFDQPELEALLGAAVPVRRGVTVTGIEQRSPDRVRVHLRHGDRAGALDAAAVLGCDGAESTVRAAVGAGLRDLRYSERWFVVDVHCEVPLDTWGGVDQICDPRRAATFLHVTGERYRFEFRMLAGESEAELVARLDGLTRPWLGAVPRTRWAVLRSAEYAFRARLADRWRDGRVLLLGDAAHLMPPFIGQGLGTGLGDAHNLAWKLAAVVRGGAGEDLLDTYEAERAPHAEALIRAAVRVGRAMTGGQGLAAALRRPAAAVLLRLPGTQARALRGIETRYPPSGWVEGRRRRHDLAGTVCPQPLVAHGGRLLPLDDLLGDGFTLLCAGPVDGRLRRRAEALGARTVVVAPAGCALPAGGGSTVVDDGTLVGWLRHGRATAVLLRPDRVVLAAAGGPPPHPRT